MSHHGIRPEHGSIVFIMSFACTFRIKIPAWHSVHHQLFPVLSLALLQAQPGCALNRWRPAQDMQLHHQYRTNQHIYRYPEIGSFNVLLGTSNGSPIPLPKCCTGRDSWTIGAMSEGRQLREKRSAMSRLLNHGRSTFWELTSNFRTRDRQSLGLSSLARNVPKRAMCMNDSLR